MRGPRGLGKAAEDQAPLTPTSFNCTQFSSQPRLFLAVSTEWGRCHSTRGQDLQKCLGEAGAYRHQVRVTTGQWDSVRRSMWPHTRAQWAVFTRGQGVVAPRD